MYTLPGPTTEQHAARLQKINRIFMVGCIVFFIGMVLALIGTKLAFDMAIEDALKLQEAEKRIEQMEQELKTSMPTAF